MTAFDDSPDHIVAFDTTAIQIDVGTIDVSLSREVTKVSNASTYLQTSLQISL